MTLGLRPALALALPALAGALLMLAPTAGAQTPAPKADGLERAQKAADAVFHWIKLNGDKGANRQQPAAAPAPTPAPAPAPKKAAPVAAAPKPAPTTAPSPAPTAVAEQATVTAAAPRAPEPEPDRTPVVLAAAAPTPAPAAPMVAAAQAVEPPKPEPEAEAEEPLKLLSKVEPVIPRQLQQGNNFRSGIVQVQFTVSTDGSVKQASVIKASHTRLGNAALEAVRQWRFAPIRKARDAAVEVAFNNEAE